LDVALLPALIQFVVVVAAAVAAVAVDLIHLSIYLVVEG